MDGNGTITAQLTNPPPVLVVPLPYPASSLWPAKTEDGPKPGNPAPSWETQHQQDIRQVHTDQ